MSKFIDHPEQNHFVEIVPMGEKPERTYNLNEWETRDSTIQEFLQVLEADTDIDYQYASDLNGFPGEIVEVKLYNRKVETYGTSDDPPVFKDTFTGNTAYRFLRGGLRYIHNKDDPFDDVCFPVIDYVDFAE